MKQYSNIITLVKNARGVYDLDTIKGCTSGLKHCLNGCYGECYANKNAKRYGIDFGKSILRSFENSKHKEIIKRQVHNIDMPFIRIGVAGDPSENWQHTINIIKSVFEDYQLNLFEKKKEVVIITKHWQALTGEQLKILSKYNVCVNTSVSALDDNELLGYKLKQYNIIKRYCSSILRIVSCDFNTDNQIGKELNEVQNKLFDNDKIIDTILRVSKNNKYVKNGIINITKTKFLSGQCYASIKNKATYFSTCGNCPEQCGINFK